MAQIPDRTPLNTFVGQVVDQATERLVTTGDDARARQADLIKAKKDAGNSLRSNDINAALDAEDQLVLDARALAKRMKPAKQSMRADLERLLAVALGVD